VGTGTLGEDLVFDGIDRPTYRHMNAVGPRLPFKGEVDPEKPANYDLKAVFLAPFVPFVPAIIGAGTVVARNPRLVYAIGRLIQQVGAIDAAPPPGLPARPRDEEEEVDWWKHLDDDLLEDEWVELMQDAIAADEEDEEEEEITWDVPYADEKTRPRVSDVNFNEPFVFPYGKKLKYYVGFETLERANSQRSPRQRLVRLNTEVAIHRRIPVDELVSAEALGPEVHRLYFHQMANLASQRSDAGRSFEWHGRSQDGKTPQPTAKYRVAITVKDRNGATFISPTTPFEAYPSKFKKSRYPAGLRTLPFEEQRIHGIRVIWNADKQAFPVLLDYDAFKRKHRTETNKKKILDDGFVRDWKSYIGPAGIADPTYFRKTYDWHHVVEENQTQFQIQQILSSRNLVRLDKANHIKITQFYNQYHFEIQGRAPGEPKLRDWLKNTGKSFEYQHQLGMRLLRRECGWNLKDQGD